MEGTGACFLEDGAGSFLSGGQNRVWWCFWGGICELSMILGSLSANGWVCVPVFLNCFAFQLAEIPDVRVRSEERRVGKEV